MQQLLLMNERSISASFNQPDLCHIAGIRGEGCRLSSSMHHAPEEIIMRQTSIRPEASLFLASTSPAGLLCLPWSVHWVGSQSCDPVGRRAYTAVGQASFTAHDCVDILHAGLVSGPGERVRNSWKARQSMTTWE